MLDHLNHLLGCHSGGFEPGPVETFGEISLVIRRQFIGEMQSNFVDKTRQVNPTRHGFTRTPGIDDIAHVVIVRTRLASVNGTTILESLKSCEPVLSLS